MPIPLIVAAVVLLVGVVAVVLSRENWRWQNITLVSLFLVLGVLFFYLGSKNLKIQQAWRNEIENYQKAVGVVEKEIKSTREGEYDAAENKWTRPSFDEVKRRVQVALQGRGRVWEQVVCNGLDQSGALLATIAQPTPTGIADKTILFVFDGDSVPANNGGQFLGEFEVTKVDGQQITLSPVLQLRQSELQRLGQRRNRPLVIYEIMPTDSHDLYGELEAAQRIALFANTVPQEVKNEFAKDGSAPAANEADTDRIWRRVKALKSFTVPRNAPEGEGQTVSEGTEIILDPKSAEEMVAAGEVAFVEGNDKVYRRALRDYAHLYRDLNLRIDSLLRNIKEVTDQLLLVQEAHQKVSSDLASREQEKGLLKNDFTRFKAEQDRITAHVAALEKRLNEVQVELKRVYADNVQKEAELVQLTYELANRMKKTVAVKP